MLAHVAKYVNAVKEPCDSHWIKTSAIAPTLQFSQQRDWLAKK